MLWQKLENNFKKGRIKLLQSFSSSLFYRNTIYEEVIMNFIKFLNKSWHTKNKNTFINLKNLYLRFLSPTKQTVTKTSSDAASHRSAKDKSSQILKQGPSPNVRQSQTLGGAGSRQKNRLRWIRAFRLAEQQRHVTFGSSQSDGWNLCAARNSRRDGFDFDVMREPGARAGVGGPVGPAVLAKLRQPVSKSDDGKRIKLALLLSLLALLANSRC